MPIVRDGQRPRPCTCPGPFANYLQYRACMNTCAVSAGKPRPSWAPPASGGLYLLDEASALRPLGREEVQEAIDRVAGELLLDFPSFIRKLRIGVLWKPLTFPGGR